MSATAPDRAAYRTHEVAKLLGYSDAQVRHKCRVGKIETVKGVDGEPLIPYLVPAEWVEQVRRSNTGPTAA